MPAITYCQNLPGREADYGSGKDRRRRRSWLVLTEYRNYDEGQLLADVISSYGLPVPYVSPHPEDPTFLCKRLRGSQDRRSPLHWIVTAEYDTAPFNDQDEETKDPLDRRAKFSWSTTTYQKAIEKDRDGNAIINSVGDYFDPPPLKDVSRWRVSVTKNVSVVPNSILTWPDRLNLDEFEIDGIAVAIGVAKLSQISIGDVQEDQGTAYRVLSYALDFDPEDKWKGKYLNQGFYEVNADSELVRITDDNGREAVTPKLLDANGERLPTPIEPADAVFLEYDIYNTMNYATELPLT